MRTRRWATLLCSTALVLAAPAVAGASPPETQEGAPELLTAGLEGGTGSTVGPDGALYVTEALAGRLTRVDPASGARTVVADCLPPRVPGTPFGGAVDVAFLGRTAYALVTLVGADVGGSSTVGVYRVDGPHTCTVVADIGAFAIAHPPDPRLTPSFFVPSGVQYALQAYRWGFLVTDGHHNRVYRVTPDGQVSEAIAFPDVVPTGLDVRGDTVYLAQAGPVPHLAENGKVLFFHVRHPAPVVVASGGPLLVDVELGRGQHLFGLSQGHFTPGGEEGAPADRDTGSLLRATRSGGFDVVADGLDRPTSLEILHGTAYVVTLEGEIWRIPLTGPGRHGGHR